MTVDEVFDSIKEDFSKSVEALRKDLSKMRTGRASVAMLDGIKVDYYGTPTPLNQLANLSAPEARQIVIQPYDPGSAKEIEKAIMASDLGLNPQNQGKILRITIPELTEERRKELAKTVRKRNEEAKIALRQIRREANDMLKQMEKDKEISEDDMHRAQKQVQELLDKNIEKSDEIASVKEKEIMEF